MNLATVILAAGKGTRMKSEQSKVLHAVAGRPMIHYSVELARALGSSRTVAVLGHQSEAVRASLDAAFGPGAVEVALQTEQKGTGHAVAMAAPLLEGFKGHVLILYGDVPGLTEPTLRRLVETAAAHPGSPLALVTVTLADPKGYGRIVRTQGAVSGVVEEKDCTDEQRRITETNAGIYCARADFLFEALRTLRPNNAQGELYLTDIVERASSRGGVLTVEGTAEEVMGVNDRLDLDRADRTMRKRITDGLLRAGVTIRQPETCRIEAGVTVGEDSEIGPAVQLAGRTKIGRGVRIEQGSVLVDVVVGDGAHIKPYTCAEESEIGAKAQVGPFAHLRPGSVLGEKVKIGNFVETKKARFGHGAKASHLSYIGDAEVGRDVNIGCGTITCNYDGYRKFQTVIEDGAFIGSDTQLVAPVRVGREAVVAAGTTVVEDVPAGALALSRTKQVAVAGYADKKKAREAARVAGRSDDKRASTAPAGGRASGAGTVDTAAATAAAGGRATPTRAKAASRSAAGRVTAARAVKAASSRKASKAAPATSSGKTTKRKPAAAPSTGRAGKTAGKATGKSTGKAAAKRSAGSAATKKRPARRA